MQSLPRTLTVRRSSAVLSRQRHIVTSARSFTNRTSLKPRVSPSMQPISELTTNTLNRLQQFTKQLTTSTTLNYHNMASDNAKSHNNQDFQLSELFNVKDKVALITGELCNEIVVWSSITNSNQAVAPALA